MNITVIESWESNFMTGEAGVEVQDDSQNYFWSRQWQEAEREAEEDMRAGRYRDFESMDELIQALKDEMPEEAGR